jgi:hypothetical protein
MACGAFYTENDFQLPGGERSYVINVRQQLTANGRAHSSHVRGLQKITNTAHIEINYAHYFSIFSTLPLPADPAKPSMLRVALEAVIDTHIGPLRVISTHLEFYSEMQRPTMAIAAGPAECAGGARSDEQADPHISTVSANAGDMLPAAT